MYCYRPNKLKLVVGHHSRKMTAAVPIKLLMMCIGNAQFTCPLADK